MNRATLIRTGRRHGAHSLVRGVLASRGDAVAHGMVHDWLTENSLKGEPMIEVGKCYFIETVTKYWTGRVSALDCDWIELEEAAWIPDTGRWNEFIANGSANEVEPVKSGLKQLIPINCVTAVTEWPHGLFREVA